MPAFTAKERICKQDLYNRLQRFSDCLFYFCSTCAEGDSKSSIKMLFSPGEAGYVDCCIKLLSTRLVETELYSVQISFSQSLLHVFFGRILFMWPCGVHCSACLAKLSSFLLNVCPSRFRFLLLSRVNVSP